MMKNYAWHSLSINGWRKMKIIIYGEVQTKWEDVTLEELNTEGSTTTSASILYDILRKLEPDAKINLSLQSTNKLKLTSGNSKFNLLCIPSDNFLPVLLDQISSRSFESVSFPARFRGF